MPVLRPSGSDFTSFVKAAAQYVPAGAAAKASKSGGVSVALPGLGAVVRASQIGALASPTTSAVVINGITAPASGGGSAGPFRPTSIAGLVLWFDTFDASYTTSGNTVTSWANKAGTANAVADTGAASINQATLNGKTSVRFPAGSNYLLISPLTYITNVRNIFIVGRFPSAGSYYSFFSDSTGNIAGQATANYGGDIQLNYPGKNGIVVSPVSGFFNAPCVLSMCSSTGNQGIWVSGILQPATTNNITPTFFPIGTTGVFIGSGGGPGSATAGDTIDMYDVIQYDGLISSDQRQKVEGYLAWKWGLQANLPAGHPYKTAAPV